MANTLFNIFARSPIRPLQGHMKKVHLCAEQLQPFFHAVLQNDWTLAEEIQNHIVHLENEADELKREFRLHLPTGLFLPVQRSDLLEIIATQDRIANKAKDISGIMLGRQMQIPSVISKHFLDYIERCLDATAQAKKAIYELDELLETGFSGNEVTLVENMIVELDHIENDTDHMQINIRQRVFDLENDLPPINVMFLYKVIDWIGEIADRAQTVGGQLQLLIAR